MSIISSAPTSSGTVAAKSWLARLTTNLKRRWATYAAWRIERAAIYRLAAMTDVQLRDIGVTRGEIEHAVRNGPTRIRPFSRYY
jgi:uncharacterized protein YjiS (DUF1127 family)